MAIDLIRITGMRNEDDVDCDAKKICFWKSHTIQNGLFFQRIELPSLLRCVERCIDNIEYCKAALFISEQNKNKSFCQLYGTNSNSSDNSITLENSLNPTSTVFEILDKCPVTNASPKFENDLLGTIKLELKQKLESWSDPESSTSLPLQAAQQFKNKESTRKRTSSKTSDDKKSEPSAFKKPAAPYLHKKSLEKISFFPEPVRPSIARSVPLAQDRFNPSSSLYVNKLLPHANHYSTTSSQISSNINNNYLPKQGYSIPTNEIPLLSPIKPAVVNHGRQGAIYSRCQGGNCYAPSLAYFQKSGYNWPCPTYLPRCEPKRPNPCFTVTCPQVSTDSLNSVPKTTLFNKEWSGSYINKPQQSNKPEPEDLSHSSVQPLSTTTVQHTESMIISWSEWSAQTPCSVTCGIGVTTRRRFCSVDGQCEGESVKEELCSSGPCPEWETWSEWTECSRSCDGGERSRSRICSVSRQCDGPSVIVEVCNVENCGQWSTWGNWEQCSVTCGIGQQIRQRQCMGGNSCIGETIEKKTCKEPLCPSWSTWESWSMCSVSCGSGKRHRIRICHGSNNCIGDAEEHEVCMENSCPEWTNWSSWTQCTETCGTKGSKLRVRTCIRNNLISSLCDGAAQDQMLCKDLPECPSWIPWSSWSICSVTCGHGQQNRQRCCLPTGMKCDGAEREFRFCQESVCPYWDEWSSWSACSVTCGFGIRERRRKCIKNDVTKEGFSMEDVIKNETTTIGSIKPEVIPQDKSDLSADDHGDIKISSNTSQHSNNVLTSTMSSVRENISVIRFIRDYNSCNGNSVDRERCDAGRCCKLTEWTTWTVCSVTCGGGIRERHRICSSQIDRLQTSEFIRSPSYSKMIRKHMSIEPTVVQHGFGPAVVGHYARSNYETQGMLKPFVAGLQRIVPVKLGSLMRIHRRAANAYNFGPFEQDGFVQKDESLCRCDGELREEDSCAEIPCPERSNASTCGWSQWTERCGCIGSCDQRNWIRTRYCIDGIPANDHASNSNIEKNPCILPGCYIGKELRRLSTTEQNAAIFRPHPTQAELLNLSQYNCRPIIPAKRDINMDCLWSSWNSDTSYMNDSKTRTRSCIGFSTKTRCECDGKLVEQVECFCPQMEMVRLNASFNAPAKFTPPSRGAGMSEERMTAYNSNFNIGTCSWSRWGRWSACSETCGVGKIIRKRSCSCRSCSFGESTEVKSCELKNC